MGLSIYNLIKAAILVLNALAVLHERRFLPQCASPSRGEGVVGLHGAPRAAAPRRHERASQERDRVRVHVCSRSLLVPCPLPSRAVGMGTAPAAGAPGSASPFAMPPDEAGGAPAWKTQLDGLLTAVRYMRSAWEREGRGSGWRAAGVARVLTATCLSLRRSLRCLVAREVPLVFFNIFIILIEMLLG